MEIDIERESASGENRRKDTTWEAGRCAQYAHYGRSVRKSEKEAAGLLMEKPRAKKKNSKISPGRPIISVAISKTGERVDVTAPGATSFDIFVSKTISGKLHLSFTPWRRARSNSIRPWILLFP